MGTWWLTGIRVLTEIADCRKGEKSPVKRIALALVQEGRKAPREKKISGRQFRSAIPRAPLPDPPVFDRSRLRCGQEVTLGWLRSLSEVPRSRGSLQSVDLTQSRCLYLSPTAYHFVFQTPSRSVARSPAPFLFFSRCFALPKKRTSGKATEALFSRMSSAFVPLSIRPSLGRSLYAFFSSSGPLTLLFPHV